MSHHRHPDDEIAFFQRLFTDSPALTADDQCGVHIGGKLAAIHLPFAVTASNPEPLFLQCIYRLVDIRHPDNGNMFNCTGRSLGNCIRQLYRSAVWDDYTIKTGSVTRPEDRTQIMRILEPVQDDQIRPPAFNIAE